MMNKTQLEILKDSERIFEESKGRVHITWSKPGALVKWGLYVDGVEVANGMGTDQAWAFCKGWNMSAGRIESPAHPIPHTTPEQREKIVERARENDRKRGFR